MSVRKTLPTEQLQAITLRWIESTNSALHEELVHVIRAGVTEAVLRSTLQVKKDTPVDLIGSGHMVNGVVSSCRKEGNSFILRVRIDENLTLRYDDEIDPGVLTIEGFLTEEEEAKILSDLERDTPRKALSH